MHNVEKQSNILYKSGDVNTERFLKYVWPFFNIMYEKVNRSIHPHIFYRKATLNNFADFEGKTPPMVSFFNEAVRSLPALFIKKNSITGLFHRIL